MMDHLPRRPFACAVCLVEFSVGNPGNQLFQLRRERLDFLNRDLPFCGSHACYCRSFAALGWRAEGVLEMTFVPAWCRGFVPGREFAHP
jgi:hypothetical protein